MITLYHCADARSFRVLWALEELGLDYRLEMLPFPPRVRAREYLDINPLGTIPLFLDGNTRMTESSAICHYLAVRHGDWLAVADDDPAYGSYLNWLFFGEQHRDTDFYYRDELERFHREGTLNELDLAFSRDQEEKVYVQDRMLTRAADLWSWIQRGAHVYVCGDAARMARDVDLALRRIVAEQGRLSPSAADAYVTALAAERRYVRDVY